MGVGTARFAIWRPLVCAAAFLVSLSACQTTAGSSMTASVDLGDAATRSAVIAALATAVGRARIELGPTNDAETSVISVLPPKPGPYEMNSTARPISFDIAQRDGHCVAVRHDTGAEYDLPDVTCKAE